MAQRAPRREAAPAEVLASLNLGYNGYTDPTLTKPQMWAAATNVFSGAFGYVQRCRFANVKSPISTPISTITTDGVTPVALVTTTVAHNLSVGQSVVISGNSSATQYNFNGTFTVASTPSGTTFTFAFQVTVPAVIGNGGVVLLNIPVQSLKFFALPGLSAYLLSDINNKLFSMDTALSYAI